MNALFRTVFTKVLIGIAVVSGGIYVPATVGKTCLDTAKEHYVPKITKLQERLHTVSISLKKEISKPEPEPEVKEVPVYLPAKESKALRSVTVSVAPHIFDSIFVNGPPRVDTSRNILEIPIDNTNDKSILKNKVLIIKREHPHRSINVRPGK